jgi:hypothetical protein
MLSPYNSSLFIRNLAKTDTNSFCKIAETYIGSPRYGSVAFCGHCHININIMTQLDIPGLNRFGSRFMPHRARLALAPLFVDQRHSALNAPRSTMSILLALLLLLLLLTLPHRRLLCQSSAPLGQSSFCQAIANQTSVTGFKNSGQMAILRSSGTNATNSGNNGGTTNPAPTPPVVSMNGASRHITLPRRTARQQRRDEAALSSFHPKLITLQIISMQCLHYFLLAFLFQLNYVLYNKSITIDRIFTDHYVRLWNPSGWADVSAILLTSLAGYVVGCRDSVV